MDRKLVKFVLFVAVFSFQFLFSSEVANAAWQCEPVYGGGEQCWGTGEILIDKAVRNPSSGLFVDNLGLNDYKFAPGEEVLFRLEVKNTGLNGFNKVTVKDVFPSYLDFVSGPAGWNSQTRTLQFDIDNLAAGESRQYEIRARVFSEENLPEDKKVTCVLNIGSVEATPQTGETDKKTDSDQAQICFEKKVLGIKVLPSTGTKFGWLVSLTLVAFSLFGLELALGQRKIVS